MPIQPRNVKDILQRELERVQKSMERLMTAYQEDLLSLDDLRGRMPELRKRQHVIHAELNAIENQLADRTGYLRLAETVTSFLARLRETAKTLDVLGRQRIVRLLVKEILVSMPSSFDTRFQHRQVQMGAVVRLRPLERPRRLQTQVTFCVRGVTRQILGIV
jgi:hypothetical protein